MPDSLRKVLLGTADRRLLVGFAWHIAERAGQARARRDGRARAGAARRPAAQARGGCRQAGWWWRRRRPCRRGRGDPSRIERLVARGRGARHRARQRVGRRHREGLQPRHRDALHRRPAGPQGRRARRTRRRAGARRPRGGRGRADGKPQPVTSAAASSMRPRCCPTPQLEQIEATLKANEARVAAARSRARRHGRSARRSPAASACAASASAASSAPAPSSRRSTTPARSSSISRCPRRVVAAMTPGLDARQPAASPTRTRCSTGKVASVDSRVDPSTRSVTVRALVPNADGPAEARHVPDRAPVARRDRRAGGARGGAGAGAGRRVRLRRAGRQGVEKRRIQTGQRRVGTVQVIDGLQAGELVVTEGTQKLRDGASVSVAEPAPRRAQPPRGAATAAAP